MADRDFEQAFIASGFEPYIDSSPDKTKRFLELNLTHDSFNFQVIPGVVPNRGLNPQTDLSLYGLHYLQRVSDADPAPSSNPVKSLRPFHAAVGKMPDVP